ncbi:MAG: type II secretion system protein [Tissierellia bacterium]|nr:type II secretion system protein [Tissierellia bacterium]
MTRSISMLRNKKGFTLIELIVVLAVLAIIMAIAVPRFGGVRESAKVDSDMATLASIAKLAEFEYVRENGVVDSPLSTKDLENLIESNFDTSKGLFQSELLKDKEYSLLKVNYNDDGYVSTIMLNEDEVFPEFTLGTTPDS